MYLQHVAVMGNLGGVFRYNAWRYNPYFLTLYILKIFGQMKLSHIDQASQKDR